MLIPKYLTVALVFSAASECGSPQGYERRVNVRQQKQTDVLQHFEYAVMQEVEELGEQAFPAEIARTLSKKLNRHVSLAQVFLTLERLEAKGFVTSEISLPEPVRGGRRRRVFKVETSGARALDNTAATFDRTSPLKQARRQHEQEAARPVGSPAAA